jgi:2-haloacid dehalogenase
VSHKESTSGLHFDHFDVLTFDCYGTLVDWESGIVAAIKAVAANHSHEMSSEEILGLYSRLEPEAQAAPYKSYREVLRQVMRGIGKAMGVTLTEEEEQSLADSLPSWKPFPDTVAALRKLKSKYKLGVISNIDDDLFAHTASSLEVPFDYLITAQQVGSYKPSPQNFEVALSRIGVPREKILHVAQSVFHDVIPAKALGITSVWVNRHVGKKEGGATPNAIGAPDLTVPDLKTLADIAT